MASKSKDKLAEFSRKRDFKRSPEPSGEDPVRRQKQARAGKPQEPRRPKEPVFVIQKHDATTLHYDFRLEVNGVLVSWAVPKGPPEAAAERRLAIKVEDHPLEYGAFEGTIPKGEYGGGTVMLWDIGTYHNLRADKQGPGAATMAESVADGLVEIHLQGERLKGDFALKRFKVEDEKEQWLMLLMKTPGNEPSPGLLEENTTSVQSGRSMEQIARAEETQAALSPRISP